MSAVRFPITVAVGGWGGWQKNEMEKLFLLTASSAPLDFRDLT